MALFACVLLVAITGGQQRTTHRVPAGTHLAIELRTPADSEHTAPGDQVDRAVRTKNALQPDREATRKRT